MAIRRADPGVQRLWEQLEDEEHAIVMERRRLQDIWRKISSMHKANVEARQTFEKEANFNFVDGDERILLNVGGHIFETTAGVLCRDRYSLLAAICKTTPAIPKDQQGAFFLDRDWWIFRYILQFLRTSDLPEDQALLREIYDEASFYRLSILRRAIQRRSAAAAVAGAYCRRGNDPALLALDRRFARRVHRGGATAKITAVGFGRTRISGGIAGPFRFQQQIEHLNATTAEGATGEEGAAVSTAIDEAGEEIDGSQ